MGELTCLFFTVLFDNMFPAGVVSAGLDVDTKTAAALCLFSFSFSFFLSFFGDDVNFVGDRIAENSW